MPNIQLHSKVVFAEVEQSRLQTRQTGISCLKAVSMSKKRVYISPPSTSFQMYSISQQTHQDKPASKRTVTITNHYSINQSIESANMQFKVILVATAMAASLAIAAPHASPNSAIKRDSAIASLDDHMYYLLGKRNNVCSSNNDCPDGQSCSCQFSSSCPLSYLTSLTDLQVLSILPALVTVVVEAIGTICAAPTLMVARLVSVDR